MSLPLGGTETQHVALRTKQGDTTLCQYTAETVEKRARESEQREVQRKEWANGRYRFKHATVCRSITSIL